MRSPPQENAAAAEVTRRNSTGRRNPPPYVGGYSLLNSSCSIALLLLICLAFRAHAAPRRGLLDPLGKIHIPIGIADSLDTLKTFVEAEGNFSPGFGSFGIYFWAWDESAKRLYAPTMDDVK